MEGPVSETPGRPRLGARVAGFLALALAALAPVGHAAPQGRPDQIFATNNRGAMVTHTGRLTANGLDKVRFEKGERETALDSDRVKRVVFGDVPPAYKDGQLYMARGDYENAANKYRIAATDGEARDVVKASARLLAAEALLQLGSTDPNRYKESADEAERFLSDHAGNRETPRARFLMARATWLSGDPAAAGDQFRALFEEGANDPPTTGYERLECLRAGLAAARCKLAAKDSLTSREIFAALDRAANDLAGRLEPEDPAHVEVARLLTEAQLGEGFVLLIADQASQARTFFERIASEAAAKGGAERFGADFGLAEALFAEGKHRDAQELYAEVSVLDHTDRDRVARSLVRLAECSQALGDTDASEAALRWLEDVEQNYGDTPARKDATEMLKKLR